MIHAPCRYAGCRASARAVAIARSVIQVEAAPGSICPLDRAPSLAERPRRDSRAAVAFMPSSAPSRAALMSGMRPSTTGVYHNPDDYRPHIRPDQTLNSCFRARGYLALGAGKIYHGGGGRLD